MRPAALGQECVGQLGNGEDTRAVEMVRSFLSFHEQAEVIFFNCFVFFFFFTSTAVLKLAIRHSVVQNQLGR